MVNTVFTFSSPKRSRGEPAILQDFSAVRAFGHAIFENMDLKDIVTLLYLGSRYWPVIASAAALFDQGAQRGNLSNIPDVEYFSLGKIFKNVTKVIAPIAKVAGPIIGGIVGGPAGAVIGEIAANIIAPEKAPGSAPPTVVTAAPAIAQAAAGVATGVMTPAGVVALPSVSPRALEYARVAVEMQRTAGPETAFAYLAQTVPEIKEIVQAMRLLRARVIYDASPQRANVPLCNHCRAALPAIGPSRDHSNWAKPGVFYRSNLLTAELTDSLDHSVFGQITFNDLPYKIEIARNAGPGRARIALAHELAHAANHVYKLGLSHEKVHDLGVFYATEGNRILNAMNRD